MKAKHWKQQTPKPRGRIQNLGTPKGKNLLRQSPTNVKALTPLAGGTAKKDEEEKDVPFSKVPVKDLLVKPKISHKLLISEIKRK